MLPSSGPTWAGIDAESLKDRLSGLALRFLFFDEDLAVDIVV